MKETIVGFAIVWSIGCILAYGILILCGILDKENKLRKTPFTMGVSFSWLLVAYFGLIMFRGYKNKKAQKNKQHFFAKLGDAALVKTTIEEYWVPATKYGEKFDNDPILPIKDSPLCKVYYESYGDIGNKTSCKNCPIHKAGFGCTGTRFYLKYQKSTEGAERKRHAMILGKIFDDVYKELVYKDARNKRIRRSL